VAIGEQRTRGFEAEVAADLRNGWQLSGALSLMNAVVTQAAASDASTVGQELSGVPRETANLQANYRFAGALEGWAAGLGARRVGAKTSTSSVYVTPGYTLADANVSYQGQSYRIQLNVKNMFDQKYYAGAASTYWIPKGDPRSVMVKTVFDF
jgi:iron complex outermembrane receptor protein